MMKLINSVRALAAVTVHIMTNMRNIIRTLHVISIGAIVLSGIVFVSTVQGTRNDETVEKYLTSAGIRKQFNEKCHKRSEAVKDQLSPLVKQAEAFAFHLGPKSQSRKPMPAKKMKIRPPQMLPTKPNLKVLGTSFFKSNPEVSLVLIEEPGKERRWFRQSGKVGEFLIKQIKDGRVIVQKGQDTFELMLEQKLERNHQKEMFSISVKAAGKSGAKPISVSTKYDVMEPMWGQEESNARLLSYANSPK